MADAANSDVQVEPTDALQTPREQKTRGAKTKKVKPITRVAVRDRIRKQEPARAPRTQRPFPSASFEDALEIADAIQQLGGDRRVRRITLFEHLKKSPDSGPSRAMITLSSAYGLTTGGYQAEHIELTETGAVASDPEASSGDKFKARFRLAIEGVAPFKELYDKYAGGKLPAAVVMRDFLKEHNVADEWVEECVSLFIVNAKFLGLLREIAGAERLLTLDHAYEEAVKSSPARPSGPLIHAHVASAPSGGWDTKCFYLTPIGADDSEQRKHADLFMECLIKPAVAPLGLEVVRADQLGEPGMIATQIMQHLKHCKLAIADMSHLNPNVFYEMGIRHAARLPMVQIIRAGEKLPFDLNQVRSVVIDTSSIYTLLPKLEIYIAEISTQAKRALEDPAGVANPITVFYPDFFLSEPARTN